MLLEKLDSIKPLIGNTPKVRLDVEGINLFTKLEYQNFMNSVKSRPAFHILREAILRDEIKQDTTVIESTSGNFGIALAAICKKLRIKFIAVIDSNINPSYENLLNSLCYRVVKITERDRTGGYLENRLKKVKELCSSIKPSYWTNQYSNKDNFQAHYFGLGKEISEEFNKLDYIFIGVSSGGTISGVSRYLKEKYSNIKIIAVDIEGSAIFGEEPKKRNIPGIGSSIVPPILSEADIDEVIHVSELETVSGCNDLLVKHSIFAGGSSGSSYCAVKKYFKSKEINGIPNVLFLCPDNGLPYVDTIYNNKWVKYLKEQHSSPILNR
jgi:N-(2-amino-2-carboxyethyl)-L-glutamate synthase